MIKLITSLFFGLLFTVSLSNAFDEKNLDGKNLFESNGCTMCHDNNIDMVGPSLVTIRMQYGIDENALISFFKGDAQARVYPAKFDIMRPQLAKIRNLYDNQQRALARYILDTNNF